MLEILVLRLLLMLIHAAVAWSSFFEDDASGAGRHLWSFHTSTARVTKQSCMPTPSPMRLPLFPGRPCRCALFSGPALCPCVNALPHCLGRNRKRVTAPSTGAVHRSNHPRCPDICTLSWVLQMLKGPVSSQKRQESETLLDPQPSTSVVRQRASLITS